MEQETIFIQYVDQEVVTTLPGEYSGRLPTSNSNIFSTVQVVCDIFGRSTCIRLCTLWRDCKTTHLLLAVCDAPHQPVEISVAGCAQIEVVYHSSQDPGVCLSQPLGVCLNGKFPGDVLAQETKQVNLFWGDRLRRTFNVGSHDSQREH